MTLLERITLLSQAKLFNPLSAEELLLIAKLTDHKTLKAGEVLFKIGEEGRELYLIAKGELGLILANGTQVATLGPGQFFGEMALFEDAPRSAEAKALSDVQLLLLSRTQLKRVILERPQVSFSLLQGLSQRLRETNSKLG